MDWQRRYGLGDLRTNELDDILLTESTQELYRQLSQGDRSQIDLCRRCKFAILC
jgi:radical SAM protein with 4Fe4S-binding SPASM domain